MIQHIEDTKTKDLSGVYFEDIDALVSSKKEAWLVNNFLFRYFSTERAAEAYNFKLTGIKGQKFIATSE
jgi:hypothetical protein